METKPRPRLWLQEDTIPGQYQIRTLNQAAAVPGAIPDDWSPIDWRPQNLTDTDHLNLAMNEKYMPKYASQPRNGIARFGAWVKRSGKGLVIRLRKNGNRATTDYTDIHLTIRDCNNVELDSSPMVELPCPGTPVELSGTSWYSRSELPTDEISAELPTIHNLLEMDVPATSSEIHRSGSANYSHIPCGNDSVSPGHIEMASSREGMASPTGTARSTLSTADTVVASETQDSVDRFAARTSRPIVRGLTIAGSVRYSCGSHPHFEPSSPVEIVRLVRDASKIGTRDGQRSLREKRIPDHDDNFDCEEQHTSNFKQREGGESMPRRQRLARKVMAAEACSDRANTVQPLLPEPFVFPVRMQFEMTASKTVYQQDLHVSKASIETHKFTTQLFGLLDPFEDKLTPIEKFLAGSKMHDIETSAEEVATRAKTAASSIVAAPPPIENAAISPRIAAQVLLEEEDSASLRTPHNDSPAVSDSSLTLLSPLHSETTSKKTSTSSTQSSSDPRTAKVSESAEEKHSDQQRVAGSPVSPLTNTEAQKRYSSMESQLVPITPMTPVKLQHRPLNEPGDRRAVMCAQTNVDLDARSLEARLVSLDGSMTEVTEAQLNSRRDADAAVLAESQEGRHAPDVGEVGWKFLPDWVDHQRPSTPVRAHSTPSFGILSDDKILAKYKNTRFLPPLETDLGDRLLPRVSTDEHYWNDTFSDDIFPDVRRAEPPHSSVWHETTSLLVSGLVEVMQRSSSWLQRHAGREPPIPEGHVRVRWTCDCGEQLFDDFVELKPGAARRLEAALNKQGTRPYSTPMSGSRGSPNSFHYTPSSSKPTSSTRSRSGVSTGGFGTPSGFPYNSTPTRNGFSSAVQMFPMQPPRFLMTCVYESRNTPKLTQIPLHFKPVQTDSDLATALREHYASINRKWYRTLRLRGLTSIEFIQFYVHRNRFADIRKCPDVPPATANDYDFTPSDVLPPMGGQYLLHLFKHPHEYDPEIFAYHYIPKKLDHLQNGIGWGIALTEGFLPERVWLFVMLSFVLFGIIFAVVWTVKEHDIQGAFGVASFMTTLAAMGLGFAQACLG